MKILQLMWHRLFAETPSFFKKLFIFMASLTGLALSLITLKEQLPESWHLYIDKYAAYLLVAGAVGAYFAKLPTTDPGLQQNELPLNRKKAKKQ